MALVLLLSGFGAGLGSLLLVLGLTMEPPAQLRRYHDWLSRELLFLRSPMTAGRLFGLQVVGLFASAGLFSSGDRGMATLLGLVSASAGLVLIIARRKRVARLEEQVEGWLGALGRALEASPSLGEAMAVSVEMVDAPLRDELEQTLSEMHLGQPIDRALSALGERVRSRTLSLAIATLEVGRETGGELPSVLRKAAGSLREMARLEGVLRTKTAEGKNQALVISLVPFPLYFGVTMGDPEFFRPLETTPTGHLLLAVAALLWLAAGFLSFKILSVQL